MFLTLVYGSTSFAQQNQLVVGLSGITTEDHWSHNETGKRELLILEAMLGYVLDNGIEIGAKYFSYTLNSDREQDQGIIISGWGPNVGYFHQPTGLFGMGTYLLEPERKHKDSNPTLKYSGGTGLLLEVGKLWTINPNIGVALQLTHSDVSYKKQTADGRTTDLNKTWRDKSLYPQLGLYIFL
jgi:hypothetical protein